MTAVRLALAGAVPLAPDEAYYWLWARAPAPGYLDHPPMVALFIRLGTSILGDGPLGVRFLGPVAAALGSVLIWDAARLLTGRNDAGIAAAATVNAMPLFAIGAGVMTPDTPLILFWTATLWALVRLAVTGDARWWPAAGLCAGLAMASKYTAAALVAGVVLWVVIAAPRQLRRPAPYGAAAIAAACFAPVLFWNAVHGWASFAKQGERLGAWQPARAGRFLAELAGAQLALATPLIFVICVAGVAAAWRRARRPGGTGWALVACVSTFSAAVMLQHAIGDRVQANWPAIVYPSAAIAAALLSGKLWRRLRVLGLVTGFAATGALYLLTLSPPLVWPAPPDPVSRQLAGWDQLAAGVDRARQAAGGDFVAAENYGLAAELARALPPGTLVVGVGARWASFALPHIRLPDKPGVSVVRKSHPADGAGSGNATVSRRAGAAVVETYAVETVRGSALGSVALLPRPPMRDPPSVTTLPSRK